MASWMVHLRTADKLLEYLPDVFAEEFIMGNIAPDSGVPNKDWSTYTPASEVSHYKTRGAGGRSVIQTDKYVDEYFTNEKQSTYTKKQYSFYLGYLTHLLTDVLWMDNVYNKSIRNLKLFKYIKDWLVFITAIWIFLRRMLLTIGVNILQAFI